MAISAESKTLRSRRRPVRAVEQVRRTADDRLASFSRLALSPPARIAYVVIGSIGLAAIAVALVGPRRIQEDVLKPLRGAVEPQAEKIWAEAQPLREQIAGLLQNASPAGRARLARSFQSWIGHFYAT